MVLGGRTFSGVVFKVINETRNRGVLQERLDWLQGSDHAALIRDGLRGLEKENLRVDDKGLLSVRQHPISLGSALTHPYITTDYSEALLEFVTPPRGSNSEALDFLKDVHHFVQSNMDDELIWSSSMPCLMNDEDEIPIAQYGSTNLGRMKSVYRSGLGYRYGRPMQLISGVHFNYSLPEVFWGEYQDQAESHPDLRQFRSEQYMGLIRNYRRYGWLILYLFGASPVLCKSLTSGKHEFLEELGSTTWCAPYGTSLRMSDIGYQNKGQALLSISANSLAEYVSGLEKAVGTVSPEFMNIGVLVDGEYRQLNANILQIEDEYYSAIRPKPVSGHNSRPAVALSRDGVEYVEARSLDLNMHDPTGVSKHQTAFLEAFLIYCLLAESPPITPKEQEEMGLRDLAVAREGRRPGLNLPRDGRSVSLMDWGKELLGGVEAVCQLLDSNQSNYMDSFKLQHQAVQDADATLSARTLELFRSSGHENFQEYALDVSRSHRDYFRALLPDTEKDQFFKETSVRSLESARAAEECDEIPFDAYLAEYFK